MVDLIYRITPLSGHYQIILPLAGVNKKNCTYNLPNYHMLLPYSSIHQFSKFTCLFDSDVPIGPMFCPVFFEINWTGQIVAFG